MRYVFDLYFYTDGDFGLDFIPKGMKYGYERYDYSEEFSDLDIAVEKIDHILTKIESELHGKDYVVDDVLGMISEFRDRLILNHSTDIFVSIGGNQEGTEMRFYTIPNTYKVKFECSDAESEMLKNASNYGKLNALSQEKEEKEALLMEKMERWEYLEDLAQKIAEQE